MPQEPHSLPTALALGGASDESLDPELAELPDPPRRARTLTVLILAVATAAAVLATVGLAREIAYALASGSPAALGELRSASEGPLEANENRLVRADAMLGAAGGIRYERPFVVDSFRTLPVAGRAEPLDMWVEVRVPSGEESGRWEPPRTFTGRLVRLDAAGPRHRGLRAAIEQATHQPVARGAWLLVDGEDPVDARWAIVLGAMFLGFAGWNAVTIARILRRVRA
ncbi:MAG TPA: hypothetical protein VH044_18300 [Polyangiaceae bacterium]|nr:hypothetical protein [Polyangiaceae bacterium]